MPLMSIIGCTGFEKEIAKLLSEDGMIDHLLVVEDPRSSELVSDLEQMGMKPQLLLPEMLPPGLKKRKGFNVLVTLQDVNLYRSPQHMKKETYEKIKFYGLVSSGVLMFYGSCEGIFEDALMDFRNSNFFLELLSSEDWKYIGDKAEQCLSSADDMDVHSPDLLEKYRECYNRLKEQILAPKAN